MEKSKVVVTLLIIAILFSVVSTVLTLSLISFKPAFNNPQSPRVVYTGNPVQGNPNGGVQIYVNPPQAGAGK